MHIQPTPIKQQFFVRGLPTDDDSVETIESHAEFETYLNRRFILEKGPDEDVLGFWSTYQEEFPQMAKLAKKLLSIPPSTIGVERSLSALRNLLTDKRESLSGASISRVLI